MITIVYNEHFSVYLKDIEGVILRLTMNRTMKEFLCTLIFNYFGIITH